MTPHHLLQVKDARQGVEHHVASVLAHLGKQKDDPEADPVQYAPRPGAMQTDSLWGDHKHIYVHSRREDADPEASFAESYTVRKVQVGKGRSAPPRPAPLRTASSSDSESNSTLRGRLTTFFKSPLGGSNPKPAAPERADFPEVPDAVHCTEKPGGFDGPLCATGACPDTAAVEAKTVAVALAQGESAPNKVRWRAGADGFSHAMIITRWYVQGHNGVVVIHPYIYMKKALLFSKWYYSMALS